MIIYICSIFVFFVVIVVVRGSCWFRFIWFEFKRLLGRGIYFFFFNFLGYLISGRGKLRNIFFFFRFRGYKCVICWRGDVFSFGGKRLYGIKVVFVRVFGVICG